MNDVGNKVDKMTALPKWPNNDDETSNTLMSGIDLRGFGLFSCSWEIKTVIYTIIRKHKEKKKT